MARWHGHRHGGLAELGKDALAHACGELLHLSRRQIEDRQGSERTFDLLLRFGARFWRYRLPREVQVDHQHFDVLNEAPLLCRLCPVFGRVPALLVLKRLPLPSAFLPDLFARPAGLTSRRRARSGAL